MKQDQVKASEGLERPQMHETIYIVAYIACHTCMSINILCEINILTPNSNTSSC